MDPVQMTLEQVDRLVRIDWAEVAEDIRRAVEATREVAEVKPAVPAPAPKTSFSWWYLTAMEEFVRDPTKIPEGVENVGVEDPVMLRAAYTGMERLAHTIEWKSGGILTKDQLSWLSSLLAVCGRARYSDYSEEAVRLFKSYGGGLEQAVAAMFMAGLDYKGITQGLAELEVNQFRIENFWEFSVNMLTYSVQIPDGGMMGWALALCCAQRAYGEEWPTIPGLKRDAFLRAMHLLGIAVPDVGCVEDWEEAVDEAIRSHSTSGDTMRKARAFLIWSVLGRGEGGSIWESILLGMALAQYPEMRDLWVSAGITNISAWESIKDEEGRFAGIWIHICPAMCSALQQVVSGERAVHVEKGRIERYLGNLEEQIREVRGMFLLRDPAPAKTPAVEEVAPTTEQPPLISYLAEHRVIIELNPKWYSYVLRESFPFSEIVKFETLMAEKAKKEGV